jgi:LmbE family N-acetylglucosaminyl deacetylase
MTKKILAIAPHPDDETLGCGGTLLRHISEGEEVHWLIMTTITEQFGYTKDILEARKLEINKVAKKYGFKSTFQANFESTTLDIVPKNEIINAISDYINKLQPNILYLPYPHDVHSDHASVFEALSPFSKSFRYPFISIIRLYETLSETEFSTNINEAFNPNLWVDISMYLDKKIEIMELYENEVGEHPFPRSEKNIRALATFRGATGGFNAAESFITLKEVI